MMRNRVFKCYFPLSWDVLIRLVLGYDDMIKGGLVISRYLGMFSLDPVPRSPYF